LATGAATLVTRAGGPRPPRVPPPNRPARTSRRNCRHRGRRNAVEADVGSGDDVRQTSRENFVALARQLARDISHRAPPSLFIVAHDHDIDAIPFIDLVRQHVFDEVGGANF
jgi:hypothetical protein